MLYHVYFMSADAWFSHFRLRSDSITCSEGVYQIHSSCTVTLCPKEIKINTVGVQSGAGNYYLKQLF